MLLSLIRTKRLAITTNNLFCTLSQYKFNVTNYVLCSNPFGDQRKWIGLNCSAICVRNYTIGDKTDVEIERELFQLKRQMAAHHNHARYGEALDAAVELADRIKNIIGEQTTSYASSLNNVALMHKALGQNEEAMEHYVKALHLYQDLSGKESSSYATTLSNLGALYKSMAEASKGMDKMELLERATEALLDARNVRQKLLGKVLILLLPLFIDVYFVVGRFKA